MWLLPAFLPIDSLLPRCAWFVKPVQTRANAVMSWLS